ncbi:hypothetical protein BaRGS_00009925 [Batillaria attramentaria]|uniref:Uncharacterized protein n=1 Tax=Batillaria attramentaria TaxID=370345 RepID=A0ABD0LHE3_9CAEN
MPSDYSRQGSRGRAGGSPVRAACSQTEAKLGYCGPFCGFHEGLTLPAVVPLLPQAELASHDQKEPRVNEPPVYQSALSHGGDKKSDFVMIVVVTVVFPCTHR